MTKTYKEIMKEYQEDFEFEIGSAVSRNLDDKKGAYALFLAYANARATIDLLIETRSRAPKK
jgi:hypothetical protein